MVCDLIGIMSTFDSLKRVADKGKEHSWTCAITLNALILNIFENHFINQFKLAALHVLQAKKSFMVCLCGKIALKERIN